MITQGASLANLTTTVSGRQTRSKDVISLTDSFQNYVANAGGLAQQTGRTDAGVTEQSQKTKPYQRTVYEKETAGSEQSSVKRDILSNVRNSKPMKQEDTDIDTAQALEEDIRSLLKEELGMDDAELDTILAELNLNVFELLQPENLQAFLLTATEAEPIELITNRALADMMQALSAGINERMDAYGITEEAAKQLALQELSQAEPSQSETQAEIPVMQQEVVEDAAQEVPVQEESEASMRNQKPETEAQTEEADGFSVQEPKTGITVQVQSGHKMNGQQQASSEASQQGIAADIVNQLSQAVQEVSESGSASFTDVQQAEIIQQVIERIRVTSGTDMNRMELQLYPEHLGRLQIQVMMKNGVLTAQIHAETEMAKEAIESQLQQLKETFQEKQLQVEAVEVSVATSDFKREQERQDTTKDEQQLRSGRSRGSLRGLDASFEEVEECEQQERLEAQGASVEFTA